MREWEQRCLENGNGNEVLDRKWVGIGMGIILREWEEWEQQ